MGLKYKCELLQHRESKTRAHILGAVPFLWFCHLLRYKCSVCSKKFNTLHLMEVKVKRKKDKGRKVVTKICIECLEKHGAKHGGDKFEAVFRKGATFEKLQQIPKNFRKKPEEDYYS